MGAEGDSGFTVKRVMNIRLFHLDATLGYALLEEKELVKIVPFNGVKINSLLL